MKTRPTTLTLVTVFSLLLAFGTPVNVSAQPEWHNFYGGVTFNGQPAPIGSVIDAYDPDGVLCGNWTVGVDDTTDPPGVYGFLAVLRDDISTDTIDEGADPGDTISFEVNGRVAVAVGNVVWVENGASDSVDLSATGTVVVAGVDFPADTVGAPDSTIRFMVGVRNDGDGLDFYGITSTSTRGWQTVNQDTFTYADSGEIVYIYFDVTIPTWPGVIPDTIVYSVFSHLDTSQRVNGSVELAASLPTDVDDDPITALPGNFQLHQNYPNPFNPTTTISFTLSSRSNVILKVFNVLGQEVHDRDLGLLPSGDNSVEYDASGFPSGIYFYRLVTEMGSQTRKMVLLK